MLTTIFMFALPAVHLLLQPPSLYINAAVFGALAIGILREKIPETVELAMEDAY